MVKQISILLLTIISFSACAKNDLIIKQQNSLEINSGHSQQFKLNKDERTVYYKGNYDINYKEPRTVWFKPLLTEKGNIISERTITLAPKDLKWSSEHYMQTGEKFNELVKDKK